jgi:hypothetical protein
LFSCYSQAKDDGVAAALPAVIAQAQSGHATMNDSRNLPGGFRLAPPLARIFRRTLTQAGAQRQPGQGLRRVSPQGAFGAFDNVKRLAQSYP